MLRTDFMPRTHYAALQEGKCRFYGISVDVALDVDMQLVANRLVPSILPEFSRCAAVRPPIVRIKALDILTDILANVLFKGSASRILGMEEPEIATTLPDAYHNLLVIVCAAVTSSVVFLSTYEGFVHFDLAVQQWLLAFYHRCADAVAQIPSRLVGLNSERALNLASGHSLLGFAKQERRKKPRHKGQMGIMENRVCGNAELVFA